MFFSLATILPSLSFKLVMVFFLFLFRLMISLLTFHVLLILYVEAAAFSA